VRPPRHSTFSREEILEAIRRWYLLYGEAPRMIDWEPPRARRLGQEWRAERFESDNWPSARMVRRHFSTFNSAIEAAGLTPRSSPRRRRPNLTGAQAITDAIVEWTRRYGDVPTMADWDPTRARRLGQDWRIARFYESDWPNARSVIFHFGSFAAAATAAGLVARPRGLHHDHRQSERRTNRAVAARAIATTTTPGINTLANSLRELARARAAEDPVLLHAALLDVAGAALAWAELHGSE
jgi:hypothetical protein